MKRGLAPWLAALAWVLAGTATADTLHGVVIVVIDGDTVLFRPDHVDPAGRAFLKLRLADVDAPERDQPFGDAATRALEARVLKRHVEVETVATDVYGRTIARLCRDGRAVETELVRRGLAWATARSRRGAALRTVQREARAARRGLWQDAAPVPPWVWRRARAKDND